jgi:ATP-binding cassette subfamily F protein uup
MDHIVDHLLVFEGNGKIKDYHSNHTQYRLEKVKGEKLKVKEEKAQKVNNKVSPHSSQLSPKRKATYKEQKEYESLTTEIESLTTEKATLEQHLSDGAMTDPTEIMKASTRIGEVIALLDEKELRWLELDEIIN